MSGVLEFMFISVTILYKLNIVDLIGLLYLKQMIGVLNYESNLEYMKSLNYL